MLKSIIVVDKIVLLIYSCSINHLTLKQNIKSVVATIKPNVRSKYDQHNEK